MGIRQEKVADSLHRFISELLYKQLSDPRLAGVTITNVEITRDLKFAKIFFSSYIQTDNIKKIVLGFNNAKGFIKKEIAKELKLRYTPDLAFYYDATPDRGAHMDMLFREIDEERKE